MTAVTFDTHIFIKRMTSAGLSDKQAEIQSETLNNALLEFQKSTLYEIVRKKDIEHLATKTDIINIIKWVAGMLIAQVAVGATLIKILS
ncbi:MAG: DUF1640 domain-containing protein [Thermodesulfobacteriota bacterium]|nr:DUF1640 domain-containing protein [Thermodesulfobacteriota bacterium]